MCGIAGLIHRKGTSNVGQEMTSMLTNKLTRMVAVRVTAEMTLLMKVLVQRPVVQRPVVQR